MEVYLLKLLNFNMGVGGGEMRTQSMEDLGAIKAIWSFPGGPADKTPPANAWDMGSIPGLGR